MSVGAAGQTAAVHLLLSHNSVISGLSECMEERILHLFKQALFPPTYFLIFFSFLFNFLITLGDI